MTDLKHEDLAKRRRYKRLGLTFEEVKTMQMMGCYTTEEMAETLKENPDYIYFVNNYLNIHSGENLETIIRKAYELLYSEEAPILKEKEEHKIEPVPEVARESMEVICTRRLLRAFIRNRVELVIDRLANNRFKTRDFVELYDREYIETLVRIVKLFSPTREISRDMIQDQKRMNAVIDRVYEELYVLTKRQRCWTCDWLDFDGLKTYEEVK